MVSKLAALLHSEIVGIYGSVNTIVAFLVVLNVVTLTPDQIAAVVGLVNVVVAPIVRGLVTPTAIRPAAPVIAQTINVAALPLVEVPE